MSFMVWKDYLVTGIDIVDQQHRGLVDMLNQAAPVLAQSSDETLKEAGPLLDALVNYAIVHFQTEEALMARLDMDPRAREHHHASHAGFGQQVSEMVRDFTQGGGVTGDRLLSFLASWLVLHIMGEDQAMARQVKVLEAGLTPAEAYVQARGGELNPAPAALSHAMVDIYSVLTRQNRELLLSNRDLDASREQIRHHNEHLEEQVRLRTAELERLADDLRQAKDAAEAGSRAKTRFLGTMSHELRTPMNAILGFSHMLREQKLPPNQLNLADHIVGASDRLLELLNGIIEYSRLEGGDGQQVASTAFSLASLLRETSEPVFAAARSKGLAATLDMDPTLPAVLFGDPGLIQRILGIYLGNAVKFTRKGAIRLQAQRRGKEPDGGLRLRFTVSDTGLGIPKGDQARLFQPFTQADDSPDRHFEGIGLGLALARELALRLNGQVGVQSEAGKGSHFWLELCLPVVKANTEAHSEAKTTPVPETSPPVFHSMPTRAPSAPGQSVTPPASEAISLTRSEPLPTEIRRHLEELDNLLEALDTRASTLLDNLAPSLSPHLGERFAKVADHISVFEYDQARVLLREVMAEASRENLQ